MRIENDALLQYFRSRPFCEWCKKSGYGFDPAHVLARGLGGGSQLDVALNLCSLCRTCHTNHHAGFSPTKEELFELIARREGLENGDVVLQALWRLQRQTKQCKS